MLRLSNIQYVTNQQHCDLTVYEKDRKNVQAIGTLSPVSPILFVLVELVCILKYKLNKSYLFF